MYLPRTLNLVSTLKRKSCFLFGPRQTGKSSLIHQELAGSRVYSLLDNETFLKFSQHPTHLREELTNKDEIVVIDEIQKLPHLLDEVHYLIEEKGVRFLLTGSSARKLRHGGVNLLGGRALVRHLHPFTSHELGEHFELNRALNHGTIPSLYFSENITDDLGAYVGTYLKEEVAAEGLTRNVPAFGRFLEVAGLSNGKMLNFTNISNDAQVARSTIQEYFSILKDTLLAYELPAWKKSIKRKPLSTSKFYFFDVGVAKKLQHKGDMKPGSPEYGDAFETFFFQELKAYCDYRGIENFSYWRSTSGFEVDFILGNEIAIEVKATKTAGPNHLKGLKALAEEAKLKRYLLVCFEKDRRKIGPIEVTPWKLFLADLWGGKII